MRADSKNSVFLIIHQSTSWILAISSTAMEHDYVVILPTEIEEEEVTTAGVISVIWRELSGGVGPWGALRPIVSVILSLVPFLFLGQHFNRQHRKSIGWFVIQFPLLLSIFLWPVLFLWSIIDAWWVSSGIVARSR
tara:strand:+ start:271 stop:678 length:408 start_codon:yes stop_codon:yes gene_type:complete